MSETEKLNSKKVIFKGSHLSFDGKMVRYNDQVKSLDKALSESSGTKTFSNLDSAFSFIKGSPSNVS